MVWVTTDWKDGRYTLEHLDNGGQLLYAVQVPDQLWEEYQKHEAECKKWATVTKDVNTSCHERKEHVKTHVPLRSK